MKKLYNKFPILIGLILGMGISICFILFEYFLVTTGISECGVIVDSCLRIITGILTLILLKVIYKNKFGKLFTTRPPKSTWLYCIPLFLYLLIQFLHLPTAESLTTAYISSFLWSCLQQIGTGFWEEAASKGILMNGMLAKWKDSAKGRLAMVFLTGLCFGATHILNFLFGSDIISCLWQALYASAFGIFVAAIYLHSGNLVLCMVIHTVWDILIRIPNYFCENIQYGLLTDIIYTTEDILELGIFPIVAIVICVKYKGNKNSEVSSEVTETN